MNEAPITTLRKAMARASSAVLVKQRDLAIEEKGVLDVVTDADKESEKILSDWVAANVPDDGIIAEEGTVRPSKSGYVWYFDPVDGTKNFASGAPFYGISAGRADKDGRADFGWLSFPAFGTHLYAQKGEGVWESSDGCEVLPVFSEDFARPLRESVIALGLTPGNRHLLDVFCGHCWNAVALGSFIYEAWHVIQGHYAAYIHTNATQFDCAAATLIAEELGLVVSGKNGKQIDLREKKIPVAIAQNQRIMDEVLEIWNKNA